MKETGVVRRIDDLGRIVIPKEIRRSLRIRDGELLEVFVDKEMIGLRKASPIKGMDEIAKSLVSVVNDTIDKNVLVSDRDYFLAVSGPLKEKYSNKNISTYIEDIMDNRKIVVEKDLTKIELAEGQKLTCTYVAQPIIMNGDAIGVVLVVSTKEDISVTDEKLANVISKFLSEYVEQ